jgi:hypothetical protein
MIDDIGNTLLGNTSMFDAHQDSINQELTYDAEQKNRTSINDKMIY